MSPSVARVMKGNWCIGPKTDCSGFQLKGLSVESWTLLNSEFSDLASLSGWSTVKYFSKIQCLWCSMWKTKDFCHIPVDTQNEILFWQLKAM
jgi:hypothetical protein